jgi:ornithine cyclodeaminase/alanine dehydrogenase
MDATWITGIRTAAASAVSARRLARPDSRTLGVLGCGVQGQFHVDALRAVLPGLSTVVAFDPDRQRAAAFASDVAKRHDVRVILADDAETAVRDLDVVVTAGPILRVPHGTIRAGWLSAGSFASAVDFDSYWHADALAQLDLFTTDDRPQLEHFREIGYFQSIPPVAADLGELVVGLHPGRTGDHQRTMACNLGVAIDDVALGKLVLDQAAARGAGTMLSL